MTRLTIAIALAFALAFVSLGLQILRHEKHCSGVEVAGECFVGTR